MATKETLDTNNDTASNDTISSDTTSNDTISIDTTSVKLLSDEEVIQQVFSHIDNKTTDSGDKVWEEPVEHYQSQERFEQEVDYIHRHYTVYCPSAALAEPGSYVARDVGSTPVVVVRAKDGVVRAFKNACRHRGVEVAQGSGQLASFVCPYHAWTYSLDGTLRGVPHQDGFPDLKKCDRGLVPLSCQESHGLVFISLKDDKTLTGIAALAETPALIPQGYRVHEETQVELSVNWKLLLESFLEGYHIRALHSDSFFPLQYDNLNVIEKIGPDCRVTFPYRSIEKLRNKPTSAWTADGRLTYVHHLFPNVIIATHPGFKAVIILQAIATDKTRQITYLVTDADMADDKKIANLNKAIEVANLGIEEDRAAVLSGQRGLMSGANEYLEFGYYESAIVHFYTMLTQALRLEDD